MNNLTVQYFAVRGRCEPILLMLLDANIPFELDTYSLERWLDLKNSGKLGPPEHPSSSLPVLSFMNKDGQEDHLAETNAILLFLDHLLIPRVTQVSQKPQTGRPNPDKDCINLAHGHAILEMSMFYLNRVFQTTNQKDWITGDTRTKLGKGISTRFLQNLEYQLKLTPSLIPGPDDILSGPTSAAFVAISFTYDVFPTAMNFFPWCGRLFNAVSRREHIQKFYSRDGGARLQLPWTLAGYGEAEYIKEVAAGHTESDTALFEEICRM